MTNSNDLRSFIRHCLNSSEFWQRGGIPEKEKAYIKALNMNDEQTTRFYSAMVDLYILAREVSNNE